MEILRLVAEGYQNKEIAQLLKISVKTVEFHKTRIMNELDIHTPAGLTRYAIDHGIAASLGVPPSIYPTLSVPYCLCAHPQRQPAPKTVCWCIYPKRWKLSR